MRAPAAGNTNETLAAVDVFDAAAQKSAQEGLSTVADPETVDVFTYEPDEVAEDSEFPSLDEVFVTREAFDALVARIDRYNVGAPHKI